MKYLLFAFALTCSASTIAQTKKTKAAPPPKVINTTPQPQAEPTGIDPGTAPYTQSQKPPEVYSFVEQMPSATFDLNTYFSKNIHYPDSARKNGVQGRVIVQFVVNEDGTISKTKVVRGIGYGCDEEAVRVIQNMPPWKPGKQNGKAVKVFYTQPMSFKLED